MDKGVGTGCGLGLGFIGAFAIAGIVVLVMFFASCAYCARVLTESANPPAAPAPSPDTSRTQGTR